MKSGICLNFAVAIARLNQLGDKLRVGLSQAADIAQVPVSITGHGSMFRIHMKWHTPANYREAYASADERNRLAWILDELLKRGYSLVGTGTGALSTPMTRSVIDVFVQQCLDVFRRLQATS